MKKIKMTEINDFLDELKKDTELLPIIFILRAVLQHRKKEWGTLIFFHKFFVGIILFYIEEIMTDKNKEVVEISVKKEYLKMLTNEIIEIIEEIK